MPSKGIELPINTLIIVVLALVVLLGILAVYSGVFRPVSNEITLDGARNNACHMLVSLGCSKDTNAIIISNFDANKNGNQNDAGIVTAWGTACPNAAWTSDNLAALCACYFSKLDEASCKKLCDC